MQSQLEGQVVSIPPFQEAMCPSSEASPSAEDSQDGTRPPKKRTCRDIPSNWSDSVPSFMLPSTSTPPTPSAVPTLASGRMTTADLDMLTYYPAIGCSKKEDAPTKSGSDTSQQHALYQNKRFGRKKSSAGLQHSISNSDRGIQEHLSRRLSGLHRIRGYQSFTKPYRRDKHRRRLVKLSELDSA